MGVNDAAHPRALLIDLAVNGQFVRHLVLFALVRPFAFKVHPSYGIDRRVPYSFLLRTPAAYPHFIRACDPNADMTENLINQTFHCQDAARNGDFFPQLFPRLSHVIFPLGSIPDRHSSVSASWQTEFERVPSVLPSRGYQRFQRHRLIQGILLPRGLDVALAVFRQHQSFFDQTIHRMAYRLHVGRMARIALFNGETRIAVYFTLRLGAREGNDTTVGGKQLALGESLFAQRPPEVA